MLESRFLQAHTKDSRRRTVRLESTASTTASSTTAVTSEAAASTATERHFVLVVVRVFVRGSGSGRLSRRDTGELVLLKTFALRDRSESRLEGAAAVCCVGDSCRVEAAQRNACIAVGSSRISSQSSELHDSRSLAVLQG